MTEPLLVEIGVEELPAWPFLRELPNILRKWHEALDSVGLDAKAQFFYTPRRLVFWHKEFPQTSSEKVEEFFGPPMSVAFKDGVKTKAYESFLAKSGATEATVETAQKDGKEVLYFKKIHLGERAQDLLNGVVNSFLSNLHFGKSMRWGALNDSFIRPIRWIVCMIGSKTVDACAYEVRSAPHTFIYRSNSFAPQKIFTAHDYFGILAEGGVMLSQDERRDKILSDIKKLEMHHGVEVEIDPLLLDEVVAITEWPTALIGSFDSNFLRVPPEMIVTSMKENQRYFPVFAAQKLTNNFVVIANGDFDKSSAVVAGNERVLRARLSDALFFYENDLKKGLNPTGLDTISFVHGLGSLWDKTQRELKIANYLAPFFGVTDTDSIKRAVELSKADLLTEAVGEFPELQGVMGSYYCLAAGENSSVAQAVAQQYLPKGEDSELPTSALSSVLAISTKLDSMMALFSVQMIPTGSKDPYALRRAAIGVVKIILAQGVHIDLSVMLLELSSLYTSFELQKLESFILERLGALFADVNPSVVKAVLDAKERDVVRIAQKIEALHTHASKPSFRDNFTTFKRVANICKDIDLSTLGEVNAELFETDAEASLYGESLIAFASSGSYYDRLGALFALKGSLEKFFDSCMVNAEDTAVRANRKALIGMVYKSFLQIADIKEITL